MDSQAPEGRLIVDGREAHDDDILAVTLDTSSAYFFDLEVSVNQGVYIFRAGDEAMGLDMSFKEWLVFNGPGRARWPTDEEVAAYVAYTLKE